jgi:hypothetical protein
LKEIDVGELDRNPRTNSQEHDAQHGTADDPCARLKHDCTAESP